MLYYHYINTWVSVNKKIISIALILGFTSIFAADVRTTTVVTTTGVNSGKFKIMEIAAIVGHTSPEMIMKNYTGFIQSEHLKIDTNIELFGNHKNTLGTLGHKMGTVEQSREIKIAVTA